MDLEFNQGFDILIISNDHISQEKVLKQNVEALRGVCINKDALVIFVTEDWPRGAGTGLGPIYAFHKAYNIAKNDHSTDLLERLMNGASVAIYYTIGENRKLAPLLLTELNNKSLIKLPGYCDDQTQQSQLTLLSALIKQSSIYANNLKGRVNIFSGEQLFLPYGKPSFQPKHKVEIFSLSIPFPTEKEWNQHSLEKHTIIVKDAAGKSILLDKIDYATLQEIVSKGKIEPAMGLAISAGAISLSGFFWGSLLQECKHELQYREGKLHANEHFWMPLTLDEETYIALMKKKGTIYPVAKGHYIRRKRFIDAFAPPRETAHLIGLLDIGPENYLFDFCTVKSYFTSNLKLTSDTEEGKLLRDFYGLRNASEINSNLDCDKESILVNCRIKSGQIKNSVLFNVEAEHVDISNSMIINSNLKTLDADSCLVYEVHSSEELKLEPNTVRVDFDLMGVKDYVPLYTQFNRDGEEDWKQTIPPNPSSFDEIVDSFKKLEEIKIAPMHGVPDLYRIMTTAADRKYKVLSKPKNPDSSK